MPAQLAAAFNAPIAGAIFALEEMHHHFSPRALISAMTAAFSANFIAGLVMSDQPVLFFDHVAPLPLKHYLTVVLIGIVTGFSGVLFNRCILWGKKIYQRLRLHWVLTGIIPFLLWRSGLIYRICRQWWLNLPVEGGCNGYLLMLFVVKHFIDSLLL